MMRFEHPDQLYDMAVAQHNERLRQALGVQAHQAKRPIRRLARAGEMDSPAHIRRQAFYLRIFGSDGARRAAHHAADKCIAKVRIG
jgi:hypothetical protein